MEVLQGNHNSHLTELTLLSYWGCTKCKIKGQHDETQSHIYYANEVVIEARDPANFEDEAKARIWGYKGLPIWHNVSPEDMELFNCIDNFSIDSMHQVYKGVVETLNNRFFSTTGKPYSLKTHMDEIEEILKTYNKSLNSSISHNLSIFGYSTWKASQTLTWLHRFSAGTHFFIHCVDLISIRVSQKVSSTNDLCTLVAFSECHSNSDRFLLFFFYFHLILF